MTPDEEGDVRERLDVLSHAAATCVEIQQQKAKDFAKFVSGWAQALDTASHLRIDESGISDAARRYVGGKAFQDLLYMSILLPGELTKDATINTLVDLRCVQPDAGEIADVSDSLDSLAKYAAAAERDLAEAARQFSADVAPRVADEAELVSRGGDQSDQQHVAPLMERLGDVSESFEYWQDNLHDMYAALDSFAHGGATGGGSFDEMLEVVGQD